MTDNKKLLGKRIQELRKRANLTQENLAELIELETGSLSAIESGRHYPSLATIEKISNVLKCDIIKFFDYNHLKSTEEKIAIIKEALSSLPAEIINIIYMLVCKQ